MRIWREVRNFVWHRWFSLQRCCKMLFRLFLLTRVVQNLCLYYGLRVCGQKILLQVTVCGKVVPSCTTVEWERWRHRMKFHENCPPPEMKSWLRLCTKLYFMSKQKGSNCDSSLRRSIAYCWAKQSVRCCFITLKTTNKIPGSFVQVADWRGRKRNLKIGAIHYLHPAPD